jgi:hypothetical protein
MRTDLERVIADSLHARSELISRNHLLAPRPREDMSGQKRRRPILVIAAVAALTTLIALVPTIISSISGGNEHRTQEISTSMYLGYRWILTEVRDGSSRTAIPASGGGYIDLRRSGVLAANNGVNALTGRYSASGRSLVVTGVGTTYVGYVGGDPIRDTVIAALNALVYGNRDGTGDGTAHDTVLAVTEAQMTLDASGLQLIFQRAEETPNQLRSGPTAGGNSDTTRFQVLRLR